MLRERFLSGVVSAISDRSARGGATSAPQACQTPAPEYSPTAYGESLKVVLLPGFRPLLERLAVARGLSPEDCAAFLLCTGLEPDPEKRMRLATADLADAAAQP